MRLLTDLGAVLEKVLSDGDHRSSVKVTLLTECGLRSPVTSLGDPGPDEVPA